MATADEYARWIVANADKKGTPAFETVAKAYRASRGEPEPGSAQRPAIAAKIDGDAISQDAKAGPSYLGEVGQQIGNLVAGGVRGAGSIGATVLAPVDATARAFNGGQPVSVGGYDIVGQDRRSGMDAGLTTMGADIESPAFKVGKLGAEVAGTLGAGGAAANGLARLPFIASKAPALIDAVRTGGMSAGNTSGLSGAATRTAGGAINGGVSAGLVDPEQAGAGSLIGGALPIATKVAGLAGNAASNYLTAKGEDAARGLMQSAIKPTLKQRTTGDADTAIQTLLDYGISPTKGGVAKLRGLIEEKNNLIGQAISGSNATIDKANVTQALGDVRGKFGAQVSPTADLKAIDGVEGDFMAHPNFPGQTIPVQAAQEMKQGTYRVLAGKYGQMGSAETEAQKGLARGLKDQIAQAVPEVGPLNAEESRLLTTLSVSERRALLEANKNPGGLALLAHNPLTWAAFMADKSSAFKALAARAVNRASEIPTAVQGAIGNADLGRLASRTVPVLASDR